MHPMGLHWEHGQNRMGSSNYHQGRVDLLKGSNAGIVIRNASLSDTGNYRLAVRTANDQTVEDIAMVTVYSDADLLPELQVDNMLVRSGDVIGVVNKSMVLTVIVKLNLPTSIKILIKDLVAAHCVNQTVCTEVISFGNRMEPNITATVVVSCSLCPRKDLHLFFLGRAPTQAAVLADHHDDDSNMTTLNTLGGLLGVFIITSLGLAVYLIYRRKVRNVRRVEQREEQNGLMEVMPPNDGGVRQPVDEPQTIALADEPLLYMIVPNPGNGIIPSDAVDVSRDHQQYQSVASFLGVADTEEHGKVLGKVWPQKNTFYYSDNQIEYQRKNDFSYITAPLDVIYYKPNSDHGPSPKDCPALAYGTDNKPQYPAVFNTYRGRIPGVAECRDNNVVIGHYPKDGKINYCTTFEWIVFVKQ